MSIYLIADKRERHVLPFIQDVFRKAGHRVVQAQINSGDYVICKSIAGSPPEVLAVIERKSLTDYSASLKDDRSANINKMLATRDRTGAQTYYLIEGPKSPAPSRKFARIPFVNIQMSFMHEMVRSCTIPIFSDDVQDTAHLLLKLVKSFAAVEMPYKYPVDQGHAEGGRGLAPELPCEVPKEFLGLVQKTDAQIAVEMWSRLAGISVVQGKVLTKLFSVYQLVKGGVSKAQLDAIRTPSNRPIKRAAKSSLKGLSVQGKKESIKILGGVPGISPKMATEILNGRKLSQIISYNIEGLSMLMLEQKKRKIRLGKPRAERIIRILKFVDKGLPTKDKGLPTEDKGLPTEDKGLPTEDKGLPTKDPEMDEYIKHLLQDDGAKDK